MVITMSSFIIHYQKNNYNQIMQIIKKQIQLISKLSQTILQYHIQPSDGLIEHVKNIRKNIRYMINNNIYEEGITQMLLSHERFQVKNKILKLATEKRHKKNKDFFVQLRIFAIEKCTTEIYNEQLWEFGIATKNDVKYKKIQKSAYGVVHLIDHVLKHLQCSGLLPLNKEQKNKYMNDHKVIISETQNFVPITHFHNMSSYHIVLARDDHQFSKQLTYKYFYNQKKTQQSIKQIIMTKSLSMSKTSNKNSLASTQASRRLSLFEFYDDQLEITVLSNCDINEEHSQPIFINIQNCEEEEFQILMTPSKEEDQKFISNNYTLFNQFNQLENEYL